MGRNHAAGLIVSSITVLILSCVPFFYDWKLIGPDYSNNKTSYLQTTTKESIIFQTSKIPQHFRDSLVSGIAAAVPAIIDCIADMVTTQSFDELRILLLFSVAIPNVILISTSFTPEVIVVIFRMRFILCTSICFMKLNIFDTKFFSSWLFVLMVVSSNFAAVFSCWLSFSTNFINILLPLFYTAFSLSSLLSIYYFFTWIRNIINIISNRPITNNERKCSVYLLAMVIISIGFFILACVYGPFITENTSYKYLSLITYIWSSFTLFVWFSHGRFIRLEKEQAKVGHAF